MGMWGLIMFSIFVFGRRVGAEVRLPDLSELSILQSKCVIFTELAGFYPTKCVHCNGKEVQSQTSFTKVRTVRKS
eukprot:m.160747 g.160747  ORF g.160747 m.160747 type:complete len:75 (-) comp14562_c0_seq1:34-258(-)